MIFSQNLYIVFKKKPKPQNFANNEFYLSEHNGLVAPF